MSRLDWQHVIQECVTQHCPGMEVTTDDGYALVTQGGRWVATLYGILRGHNSGGEELYSGITVCRPGAPLTRVPYFRGARRREQDAIMLDLARLLRQGARHGN